MNKTRTFLHGLKEQIECIKNMLLPRKTDYYFKSYNVSNMTSLVTNNVCNVNGPRYKKTVTILLLHATTVKVFKIVMPYLHKIQHRYSL